MCFRTQFLRKMPPVQLVFLFIVRRIFYSFLTVCNTSSFLSRSIQLIFSILLQHDTSKLEVCLTVHLPHEIIWNANLMQGNFINVFLAPHISGTYAHHQEHQTLSRSILSSAPSFWMGGGLESCCVGCVCGADGAARQYINNKITLLHQVGISNYFIRKMHG